jgi:hypothetical protein
VDNVLVNCGRSNWQINGGFNMIFESDDKLKFERMKQLPRLKQEIISYLFDFVARKPRDQWWRYKGEFKYDGKEYELECDCKYDNQMFSYRNLHIAHKQEVIDVDDLAKQGLLQ